MIDERAHISGTISSVPIGAAVRNAILFPSWSKLSPLLSAIALGVALLGLIKFVEPSTAPHSLLGSEPSPTGTWHCGLAGGTADLTVDRWRYVLTVNGGAPVEGALTPVGGRTPKNNMALVHVVSGPLQDDFGIRVGFYDNRSKPEQLTFNMGPGAGVSCALAQPVE